ncbi:MAG: porphobilinogen synthase, partial [Nitrospina sp.]|nr:porphobilinogen synthase [Nitrospina sp.]
MINRPRRNRLNPAIRGLIRETVVSPANLVWPAFVQEGNNLRTPIVSMPGISRLSIDQLVADCQRAFDLGIPAVALFPALDDSLKNSEGTESLNPNGLLQRAVKELKKTIPGMLVITDVA